MECEVQDSKSARTRLNEHGGWSAKNKIAFSFMLESAKIAIAKESKISEKR